MKKTNQPELSKGCSIAFGIAFIAVFIFIVVRVIGCMRNTEEKEIKTDYSEEWATMNYDQRADFLNKALEEKTFIFADELHYSMIEAIKKELVNPKTVRFLLSPYIYNGFANVVEADSGWIYVPYRCTAKNDFGIEKEIAGSVMYKYNPETNSLEVKRWDINQNN